MSEMERYERPSKPVYTDGEKAAIAVGGVLIAAAAVGKSVELFVKWRRTRKSDKIQEEYNKIWDEYKYYQGEESAD